jgi:hypothetical protein
MEGYLGEIDVTDQHNIDPIKMALDYIEMYGAIDGAHHKDWLLDQVARILHGAPVTIKKAQWDNGYSELRYEVGECQAYHDWVKSVRFPDGEDGENYGYDIGVAP